MEKQWIFMLLALLAGAFVPIQTGANAVLSKSLGNSMLSGLVVFMVAGIIAFFILLYQRPELPSLEQLKSIPFSSFSPFSV